MATRIHLSAVGLFISLTIRMTFGDQCPSYEGCTTNSDCTKLTCERKFLEKDITTTIKLNTCEDTLSVTVSLDVEGLSSWSHTFTNVEDIGVPGFSYNVGLVKGGVYVRAEVKRGEDKVVKISVKLIVKMNIFGAGGKIGPSITIMEGNLGTVRKSFSDCGAIAWFSDQDTAIQIAIVAGLIVGLVLITGCCCCCFCCCRCCKERSDPGQVITVHGPSVPVNLEPVGSVKYERFGN